MNENVAKTTASIERISSGNIDQLELGEIAHSRASPRCRDRPSDNSPDDFRNDDRNEPFHDGLSRSYSGDGTHSFLTYASFNETVSVDSNESMYCSDLVTDTGVVFGNPSIFATEMPVLTKLDDERICHLEDRDVLDSQWYEQYDLQVDEEVVGVDLYVELEKSKKDLEETSNDIRSSYASKKEIDKDCVSLHPDITSVSFVITENDKWLMDAISNSKVEGVLSWDDLFHRYEEESCVLSSVLIALGPEVVQNITWTVPSRSQRRPSKIGCLSFEKPWDHGR